MKQNLGVMRKKILLVDDDASVRKLLARVLEMENYEVVLAGTGREALSRFRADPPDLVMLDLNMPELNGWQALEHLRSSGATPPVIIMTGNPYQSARAVQAGANALIEKPLHLPLLLKTIDELLVGSATAWSLPALAAARTHSGAPVYGWRRVE